MQLTHLTRAIKWQHITPHSWLVTKIFAFQVFCFIISWHNEGFFNASLNFLNEGNDTVNPRSATTSGHSQRYQPRKMNFPEKNPSSFTKRVEGVLVCVKICMCATIQLRISTYNYIPLTNVYQRLTLRTKVQPHITVSSHKSCTFVSVTLLCKKAHCAVQYCTRETRQRECYFWVFYAFPSMFCSGYIRG